jgi:cobyrinic acid a,c-diamide synthase
VVTVPRVVVSAPGSGHGKTTIATGLIAALTARGLTVSPHKVGPDYIDPSYHALAAGRPGRNLDPWLVDEDRIAPLFLHGFRSPRVADVAVIEGVMGLFDGKVGTPGFGSTAHVASLLDAPVLLVVDASGMSRSVAALVQGFSSFDTASRPRAVVFNRVGSDRHEEILREAMAEIGMPVLGAVRRHDGLATPSRHLGLIPAAEREAQARAAVERIGEVVGAAVDLDALMAIARSAPELISPAWTPVSSDALTDRPVLAVAGGAAFTFSYAETAEMLTAAGAEVVTFDPLRDESLPEGASGLVIGGGFPEVHARDLSANVALRQAVRDFCAAGGAVAAECAGLLFLAQSLDGLPMCDVLPVTARMSPRLSLAYVEAVAATDSVFGPAGTIVRGHEFHRTECTPGFGAGPAWRWTHRGTERVEGFAGSRLHASYLHLHWAGAPEIAPRFVAAAAATRTELAVRSG